MADCPRKASSDRSFKTRTVRQLERDAGQRSEERLRWEARSNPIAEQAATAQPWCPAPPDDSDRISHLRHESRSDHGWVLPTMLRLCATLFAVLSLVLPSQRHRPAAKPVAVSTPCGSPFAFQILLDRQGFSHGEIDGTLGV